MIKAKLKTLILPAILMVLGIIVYTQITIFVVPPIGAVPEGTTMVIPRLTNTEFVDSADAMCERIQGYVNLLCRATALGSVAQAADGYPVIRLPYSEFLYRISTP